MIKIMTVLFAAMFSMAMLLGANDAHAFLLDGFGDDQATSQAEGDGIANGGTCANPGCTATDGPMAITDTDLTNATRTLTIVMTDDNGGTAHADVEVLTDLSGSRLTHSQDDGVEATTTVDWAFAAEDFSVLTSMSLVVDVISADVPLATIAFTLCNGGDCYTITSAALGTGAQSVSFDLATYCIAANIADCTGIDSAQLVIDGSVDSLDMSIDFVGTVPEPATLALFGFGLLGFGVLFRRRRQVL